MNISVHQNIQKYVTALLMVIPKEELYKCLQQQQHCWAKCTVAEKDYTEGDLSHDALYIYTRLLYTTHITATPHTHNHVTSVAHFLPMHILITCLAASTLTHTLPVR